MVSKIKEGQTVTRDGEKYFIVSVLKTKLKARKINKITGNVSHAIFSIKK